MLCGRYCHTHPLIHPFFSISTISSSQLPTMNPSTSTMAAAASDIDPERLSINNEATKSLPDPYGLVPRVTPTRASLNTEIYPPSAAPMAGAATPTVAAAASEFNPRQPSVTNETTKSPTDSFGLFPHVTPMNTSLNTEICPPPPAPVAGAAFVQLSTHCPTSAQLPQIYLKRSVLCPLLPP